jgi:hypothetical protein
MIVNEMMTTVITNDSPKESGHNDDEGNGGDYGGGCNDSYCSDGCDSSCDKGAASVQRGVRNATATVIT